MIEVTKSIEVSAARAWEVLLHRIEQPADYALGIESSEILSKDEQTYIRKIETLNGSVTERIVLDKEGKFITHFLVKHPFFQGTTVYQIEAQGAHCLLHIHQDWTAKKAVFEFAEREEALNSIAEELSEHMTATE